MKLLLPDTIYLTVACIELAIHLNNSLFALLKHYSLKHT